MALNSAVRAMAPTRPRWANIRAGSERIARTRLDEGEERQQDDGEGRADQDDAAAPAGLGGADENEHQQGDPRGGGQCAQEVEVPLPGQRPVGGEEKRTGQRDSSGQRDVDEEHRLPAEGVDEYPAEQGAEAQAARAGGSPHGQGPVTARALVVERVDQGQSGGKQQGAADALDGAHRNQDTGGAGQSAHQ